MSLRAGGPPSPRRRGGRRRRRPRTQGVVPASVLGVDLSRWARQWRRAPPTRRWPTTPSRRRPRTGRPRPVRPSRRTSHLHGRESPRSQPSRRPHSLLFWAGAATAVPLLHFWAAAPRHSCWSGGCRGARRGLRFCGQCSPQEQQEARRGRLDASPAFLLQTKLVPGGRGGRCRRRLDSVGGWGVPGRRRPRSAGSCTSRDSMTRGDRVNSHS